MEMTKSNRKRFYLLPLHNSWYDDDDKPESIRKFSLFKHSREHKIHEKDPSLAVSPYFYTHRHLQTHKNISQTHFAFKKQISSKTKLKTKNDRKKNKQTIIAQKEHSYKMFEIMIWTN